MIRIEKIQDELLHLVGWEQGFTAETLLADDLTQTESGLTFQQAHPMVTLDNIRAIMPEQYLYTYPTYNADTEYGKGAKVSYSSKVWESLENHNEGNTPADGSEYWKEYDFVSVWIERLTRSAIAKTVQTFLQKKSLLRRLLRAGSSIRSSLRKQHAKLSRTHSICWLPSASETIQENTAICLTNIGGTKR